MFSAFMPESASVQAVQTDRIYSLLLAFSVAIVVIVGGLVIVFSIRYRRGSKADRAELPPIMTSFPSVIALKSVVFAASVPTRLVSSLT